MSSRWSLYVVPDSWTLKDCMTVAYSYHIQLLMSDKEFKEFNDYSREIWTERYDALIRQPHIYCYTSTDGDPDYEKIMEIFPTSGRLFSFDEEVYKYIPKLKDFVKQHEGKRYICMN